MERKLKSMMQNTESCTSDNHNLLKQQFIIYSAAISVASEILILCLHLPYFLETFPQVLSISESQNCGYYKQRWMIFRGGS